MNGTGRQVESHLLHVHYTTEPVCCCRVLNKVLIEAQQLQARTRPNTRVAFSKLLFQETVPLKSHHVETLELEHVVLKDKQNEIPNTTQCRRDLHKNKRLFVSSFKRLFPEDDDDDDVTRRLKF